jgi:putative membrane protein
MRALIVFLLLSFTAVPALAHGGEAHGGPAGWTFDPWIVTPILMVALPYLLGSLRLWGRKKRLPAWPGKSGILFWTGLATLVLALVSPLHEWGEHLFTVHMIEHELVMAVAAPLLVLARPVGPWLWGLPDLLRRPAGGFLASATVRSLWRVLTQPFVATLLHGLTIWAWHAPSLFDETVNDVLLHRLQHLSFFLTAMLFWWAIIWRCERGTAAWHLFVTMLHTGVLGALIALAPGVIYFAQTRYATDWGMTPLEDQQLAGIIMWVPGGIVYAGAALWCLAIWINGASKGGPHAKPLRAA